MPSPASRLGPGSALLLVDVQVDFCPGGALPVPSGDGVVPVLNRWLAAARARGVPVYVSRDWHPPGHPSFAEAGGPWPAHCVQDSPGAAWHPDLELPPDAVPVSKGARFDRDQLSAFDATGLGERLVRDGVKVLWIGGLAGDVCVRATALDALAAGFEVHVLEAGVRSVDPEAGAAALAEMRAAGATIESDA
jgi:nicotinamidase/pyrazinamidase